MATTHGMLTPFALRIRSYAQSEQSLVQILHAEYQWRKARMEFIKVQSVCQMCGIQKELQVHHVYPWHLFLHLRFNKHNFVTLCQPCHFRFGHWQDWQRFNPEILALCVHAQQNNPVIPWDRYNLFQRDTTQLTTVIPTGPS